MRSLAEIGFRLKQELANVRLLTAPPGWAEPLAGPLGAWPAAETIAMRVRGSALAARIEELAGEVLNGRYRLLGLDPVDLPSPVRWRRDFVHGRETGLSYFRRIPYLDFERVGDHKIVWELNRHQHLVLLAQAFVLTGKRAYVEEIQKQLEHWMDENPFQRGINWTSALEVGFRVLSWLWVLHLAGQQFPEAFRRRWMRSLYHHGCHLEYNLSVYFSPNTHLLGEAVVLAAMGRLLPAMPGAQRWRQLGRDTVLEQMRRQVRDDGSHFEQSSYYHLYAVDLFLLHLLLEPETPAWYRAKLAAMIEFLNTLVSCRGWLPLLGDEDGGRLFFPYGDRRRFAEATLATGALLFDRAEWMHDPAASLEQAAWWLPRYRELAAKTGLGQSRWFPDAGLAVLRSGSVHIVFDAGPFGAGSAGHSHADTLSITAFLDGEEWLIDPGTFTYVSDPQARERYRSTGAHNTVSIDSLEQATPRGPFRWSDPPEAELLHWSGGERADIADAQCRYRGFAHRRSVAFRKPDVLLVVDQVSGAAPGSSRHRVEQRWLCPSDEGLERIEIWPGDGVTVSDEPAERSATLGATQPAVCRRVQYEGVLPMIFVAAIRTGGHPRRLLRQVCFEGSGLLVEFEGGQLRVEPGGVVLTEIV